jgi:hypothetical protein
MVQELLQTIGLGSKLRRQERRCAHRHWLPAPKGRRLSRLRATNLHVACVCSSAAPSPQPKVERITGEFQIWEHKHPGPRNPEAKGELSRPKTGCRDKIQTGEDRTDIDELRQSRGQTRTPPRQYAEGWPEQCCHRRQSRSDEGDAVTDETVTAIANAFGRRSDDDQPSLCRLLDYAGGNHGEQAIMPLQAPRHSRAKGRIVG